jgi:hypothetical protein
MAKRSEEPVSASPPKQQGLGGSNTSIRRFSQVYPQPVDKPVDNLLNGLQNWTSLSRAIALDGGVGYIP